MQQEFTPAPAEAESGQERLLDGVLRITQDGFAVGLQDRTTPADLNQAWMTPREPHCVHGQSHASNAEAASAVHGWSCPRGLIELSCPEGADHSCCIGGEGRRGSSDCKSTQPRTSLLRAMGFAGHGGKPWRPPTHQTTGATTHTVGLRSRLIRSPACAMRGCRRRDQRRVQR